MPDPEYHDPGGKAPAEEEASSMATPLFQGGSLLSLQQWLGLIEDNDLHIGRTAALVVLIGWLPDRGSNDLVHANRTGSSVAPVRHHRASLSVSWLVALACQLAAIAGAAAELVNAVRSSSLLKNSFPDIEVK